MTTNYHQPLIPERIYHLFNRAIGDEKLFNSDENYKYFLMKLKEHTNSVCRIYCYSLLPNHFHLLIKVLPKFQLVESYELNKKNNYIENETNLSEFVMERFSNFLNGYSKAFNKMYQRKGALFIDFTKRAEAKDNDDFSAFVFYIHKNAVHHKICKKIGEWKYDSYNSMISAKATSLLREELINFYGDLESFILFHNQYVFPKDRSIIDLEK